jgi:hypothetical protein
MRPGQDAAAGRPRATCRAASARHALSVRYGDPEIEAFETAIAERLWQNH